MEMVDITPHDVLTTYRRFAPFYDFLFGKVLGPGRSRMAQFVVTLQPEKLLEVGIGTGLSLPIYPPATRIVGIDLSGEMLDHAKEQASRLHGRDISLHVMDAESLDFGDDSFDCVTAPYVLSVTPNPDKLVAELRRVCKPGGTILIVNHFSGSRFWWLLEKLFASAAGRIGFRSTFDYDRHVVQHDWQVQRSIPVNMFGLSRLVIIRNAPCTA